MSDDELERLKEKRLKEMQQNITSQNKPEPTSKPTQNPRDVLISKLGYRGLEVLENAEMQFPNQIGIIIEKLAEIITSGELNEELDGGKLLAIFRLVGISVRMQNKINVEQDGKFVSLSEKLNTLKS